MWFFCIESNSNEQTFNELLVFLISSRKEGLNYIHKSIFFKYMIIGIDASNIRMGGGLTHLKAILESVNPKVSEFSKIILWSSNSTLHQIPDYSFLEKQTHPFLNKSNLFSVLFQFLLLKKEANSNKCDLVFAPGGTFISSFRPFVTMSQNMLPFEEEEAKHYYLKMRIRLKLLFCTQSFAFKKSNGLIFLTNYAKNYISKKINIEASKATIIPHGVSSLFQLEPREQLEPSCYTPDKPFEFLYVSYITVYKHQWNIAEAVCQMHQEGYPVRLKLIGSVWDSFDKVKVVLEKYPNSSECIQYIPGLPHNELITHYHNSDAFVFGSTCENMPIILIEAMSAGLPIASSNYGPMQEVLEHSAIYFDPRKVEQIKEALQTIFENDEVRAINASRAFKKTQDYTWENCANETFSFLVKVAKEYKR